MTAQTTAQRQEALRAKRAMLGMTEVRGIFAHPEDHQRIKEYAAKAQRARERPITNLQAIRRGLLKSTPIGVIEASANPVQLQKVKKRPGR